MKHRIRSSPEAHNWWTTCKPRNPQAPVTKTVIHSTLAFLEFAAPLGPSSSKRAACAPPKLERHCQIQCNCKIQTSDFLNQARAGSRSEQNELDYAAFGFHAYKFGQARTPTYRLDPVSARP